MTKIHIMETVLRDGQQSQIATRMTTKEMLPVLKTLDEAGYHALEMWGGATFDSCLVVKIYWATAIMLMMLFALSFKNQLKMVLISSVFLML